MIPHDKFKKAERYLRRWIGRLTSAKSAPKKDEGWRNGKYSYIHTNIKKFALEKRLRGHLSDRYNVSSMKDLDDKQLARVYAVVAGWKKANS